LELNIIQSALLPCIQPFKVFQNSLGLPSRHPAYYSILENVNLYCRSAIEQMPYS
jgi:hypothetical protein